MSPGDGNGDLRRPRLCEQKPSRPRAPGVPRQIPPSRARPRIPAPSSPVCLQTLGSLSFLRTRGTVPVSAKPFSLQTRLLQGPLDSPLEGTLHPKPSLSARYEPDTVRCAEAPLGLGVALQGCLALSALEHKAGAQQVALHPKRPLLLGGPRAAVAAAPPPSSKLTRHGQLPRGLVPPQAPAALPLHLKAFQQPGEMGEGIKCHWEPPPPPTRVKSWWPIPAASPSGAGGGTVLESILPGSSDPRRMESQVPTQLTRQNALPPPPSVSSPITPCAPGITWQRIACTWALLRV